MVGAFNARYPDIKISLERSGAERVMQRMVGMDDGVVDALFAFTRPVTGGYFWCPPQVAGKLDLKLPT